jgi:hypothetical protein
MHVIRTAYTYAEGSRQNSPMFIISLTQISRQVGAVLLRKRMATYSAVDNSILCKVDACESRSLNVVKHFRLLKLLSFGCTLIKDETRKSDSFICIYCRSHVRQIQDTAYCLQQLSHKHASDMRCPIGNLFDCHFVHPAVPNSVQRQNWEHFPNRRLTSIYILSTWMPPKRKCLGKVSIKSAIETVTHK